MTIKPRYRKMASKEHEGYDLFVSLRLPASDMSDLLQAAAIGWNRIAERCPTEGFPADEPYWRAKAAEANEAAFLIDEEIKSGKLDRKMIEKKHLPNPAEFRLPTDNMNGSDNGTLF